MKVERKQDEPRKMEESAGLHGAGVRSGQWRLPRVEHRRVYFPSGPAHVRSDYPPYSRDVTHASPCMAATK